MKMILIGFSITAMLMGCQSTENDVATQGMKAIAPLAQLQEMASHYEQAGELDKALVYYLKALEDNPQDLQLTYRVAGLHKLMGKPQFALHMLQRILDHQPDNVQALNDAGILLLENKDITKATDYLLKVVSIDQKRLKNTISADSDYVSLDQASPLSAYNGLGVAYDLVGRYEEAKALYRLHLEFHPSPMVLTNLGYSFYLSGRYDDAITNFRRAIDIAPAYQRSWTNLGLVYTRMGRYNKAFQTLTRVMTDAQAYNDLGYFLMLEQRYEEAEYFFEQAIAQSPRYFDVAYENLNDVRQHLSVMRDAAAPAAL